MSDFVRFPETDYERAGDVFAGFRPHREFTLKNALAMMWFAQLAYEVDTRGTDPDAAAKIARIGRRWNFAQVRHFRGHRVELTKIFNTTGLIGVRDDAIILAFAGTDPVIWETVVTDARFLPNPQTHTHRGFQAAFEAVADSVAEATQLPGGKPLFATGHSLGAALAILAADKLTGDGFPPLAVYGYGTPRVGNQAFQSRYNARVGEFTYRLVHGSDVVSRVPMFAGYRHVGKMLFCESNTKFDDERMSGDVTDDPSFLEGAIEELIRIMFRSGANLVELLASRPRTLEEAFRIVVRALPSPETTPVREFIAGLPPFIREHLQDRYIEALTPGAIKMRED